MNGKSKDKNLLPENIVSGVEIDGVVGTATKYDVITESYTYTISVSAGDVDDGVLDTFTGMEYKLDCTIASSYGYTSYNGSQLSRVSPYVLITDVRVTSAIANTPVSSSTYIDGKNLENIGKDFKDCFFVQPNIVDGESTDGKNSWANGKYDLQYTKFNYEFILYTSIGKGTLFTDKKAPTYFNSTGDRTGGTPFVITIEIDYVKKW